jgi:peptidoglycan/xylan/chitin deacetylase (PgdA/CDA1 family)
VSHPLIEADARANLCLHDIADDPSVIYTLPKSYLLAVIDGLRTQGIADRVTIYFDDGYASLVEAVRTLSAYAPEVELVAALTLSFLGQPGHIGWSDIEALHRDGVRIAAHGREHLHMDQLNDSEILAQLTASRDALQAYSPGEFVFPFGSYNNRVLEINDRHKLFPVMTTVDYGWDHGQPLRPRLMVTSQITPAEVVARLGSPD